VAAEILMPTENIFPVVCGDKEYILKENDILIIPPGELHNLKALKSIWNTDDANTVYNTDKKIRNCHFPSA